MKMFFAGTESPYVYEALVECNAKRVLVSYYYVQRKNVDLRTYFNQFEEVVMDSGAFSMLAGTKSTTNHDKWLQEYIDKIREYKGLFTWVANYDINLIVGDNLVYDWNEKFLQLEEEGQRVCFVSHDYRYPYKNLYEYFNKYKYVGVSGGVKGKIDTSYIQQVFNLSRAKKVLTHGFAMTSFVSMQLFPFTTTDSTTYLGSARYGSTYVWNGAFFETWDYLRKYRRKTLHHWCEKWGLNYEKFILDDHKETTKFAIMAWLENEKHFNRITRHKQWWLTDEEKKDINKKIY